MSGIGRGGGHLIKRVSYFQLTLLDHTAFFVEVIVPSSFLQQYIHAGENDHLERKNSQEQEHMN